MYPAQQQVFPQVQPQAQLFPQVQPQIQSNLIIPGAGRVEPLPCIPNPPG